jgi:hypothetical protein
MQEADAQERAKISNSEVKENANETNSSQISNSEVKENANETNSSQISNSEVKENANETDVMSFTEFLNFLTKHFNWSALKILCVPKNTNVSKNKTNRVIFGVLLFLGTMFKPLIIILIYGFIGFMISYQIYYKCGALKAGDPAWGMLNYKGYHIHHWIYCSIILICLWLVDFLYPFLIGLCFGGILHGIQYPDWSQFSYQIEPKPHLN